MEKFTYHDEQSAPEQSRPLLAQSRKAVGMIPNLHAIMAESPAALEAYQTLNRLFTSSSFNAEEQTVVWQTINVENACHYCVPAHTAIAKSMGVSDDITNALRDETTLPDAKLEALRTFTLAMMRSGGRPEESAIDAFLAAGYGHRQILEVILGLSQKTLSNYVNHIAGTDLDRPFEKFAWQEK